MGGMVGDSLRGGDPLAATKALTSRNAPFHWPSRQAVHKLRARPAALPPSSPRTMPPSVGTAKARVHNKLGARRGGFGGR